MTGLIKKRKSMILFCALILMSFAEVVIAQRNDPNIKKKAQLISVKCNFTFELVESEEASTMAGKYLDISTVLEPKYFTTTQLKKYFTCWSKELPQITQLRVIVLSDRSLFEVPPAAIKSDLPDRSEEIFKTPPNHYKAIYTRSAEFGTESFFYNPDPKNWKRITYKFKKHTVPLKRKRGR
ncbi:MAG TPA: hypothetical protein PKY82_31675 [Pyrinomonadaceae bacterium]|nr:hypothetical protein [Pyrinomonadaceae bacterium]